MTRARRLAEAFTPDGLGDRVNGLLVGARLMREEYAAGAAETESAVRDRMGLTQHPPALTGPNPGRPDPARPLPAGGSSRDTDHARDDEKDDI